MNDLAIGSTVWVFDHSYREYKRDEKGRAHGGPIYRKHWREVKITGETARSWTTTYGKFPKNREPLIRNGPYTPYRVALTAQEVDDDIWRNAYAYPISDAASRADVATLRKVAELVGFTGDSE